MNFLTATYMVKGGNFPLLIERLQKKNIKIHKIKSVGVKKIFITIDYSKRREFFAICNNMWYNKRVNYGGVLLPLKKLISRFGVIIGAVLFVIISCLWDGVYISTNYLGDSGYFLTEINEVLEKENVKKYTAFSKINCEKLENEIFSYCPLICFCTVEKKGNRLEITTVKAKSGIKKVDTHVNSLISNVDGEIVEITVYRGTAVKRVGEKIKTGDELVAGYYIFKENKYTTYVLAKAVIKSEKEFRYKTLDNSELNVSRYIAISKYALGVEAVKEENRYEKGELIIKLTYLTEITGE